MLSLFLFNCEILAEHKRPKYEKKIWGSMIRFLSCEYHWALFTSLGRRNWTQVLYTDFNLMLKKLHRFTHFKMKEKKTLSFIYKRSSVENKTLTISKIYGKSRIFCNHTSKLIFAWFHFRWTTTKKSYCVVTDLVVGL